MYYLYQKFSNFPTNNYPHSCGDSHCSRFTMEMPASESRRDSLEASFNDSIMDTISCNNENLNATLDLSQVSGWSALTPGWNDSFKISLVDSESEEASDRVAQQNQEQERLVS